MFWSFAESKLTGASLVCGSPGAPTRSGSVGVSKEPSFQPWFTNRSRSGSDLILHIPKKLDERRCLLYPSRSWLVPVRLWRARLKVSLSFSSPFWTIGGVKAHRSEDLFVVQWTTSMVYQQRLLEALLLASWYELLRSWGRPSVFWYLLQRTESSIYWCLTCFKEFRFLMCFIPARVAPTKLSVFSLDVLVACLCRMAGWGVNVPLRLNLFCSSLSVASRRVC